MGKAGWRALLVEINHIVEETQRGERCPANIQTMTRLCCGHQPEDRETAHDQSQTIWYTFGLFLLSFLRTAETPLLFKGGTHLRMKSFVLSLLHEAVALFQGLWVTYLLVRNSLSKILVQVAGRTEFSLLFPDCCSGSCLHRWVCIGCSWENWIGTRC